MENIQIREVSLTDIDQLRDIGRRTFSETFAAGNTEENLAKYLEEGFSPGKLAAELTDPGSQFFFAEAAGRVIGYLKLNAGQSQTELKEERAMEIERIYVLGEFQGKKVGQLLCGKAIELARQKGADFLWLGVWEENRKALGFYRKNGFVEFDRHLFRLGDEEQTDIMLKLKLRD